MPGAAPVLLDWLRPWPAHFDGTLFAFISHWGYGTVQEVVDREKVCGGAAGTLTRCLRLPSSTCCAVAILLAHGVLRFVRQWQGH